SSAVLPALLRLQRLVALRRDGGLGEPVRRREPELGRVRGGSVLHGRVEGHAAIRALARPGDRDLPLWWHPLRLALGARELAPNRQPTRGRRTFIIGAGEAGEQLLRQIQ